MQIVESYALAVALCIVTRLCWGSWAEPRAPFAAVAGVVLAIVYARFV